MFSRFSSPRSIFILLLLWLLTACQPPAEQTATRPTKEPTLPPTIAPTYPTTPMIPTHTPTTAATATAQPPTPNPTATLPPQPGRILYLAADSSDSVGYSANGDGQVYSLSLNPTGEVIGEPTLFSEANVGFGPLVSSPDGSRVLVVDKIGMGDRVIVLYPNTNQVSLNILSGSDSRFFYWFPDSHHIVVRKPLTDLRWLDVDTEQYLSLFDNKFDPDAGSGIVASAAVSPDGQTIVYGQEGGGHYQIWMMNSDGSNRRFLRDVEVVSNLAWSPDGQFIAFVGGDAEINGVVVMDADGSNPRSVSHNFSGGHAYPVLWSPDSRRLAFNGIESPNPALDASQFPSNFQNTLYVVDVVTGEEKALLPDGTGSADPAWSPDGQQLVFASYRSGNSEIWAVNVDGSYLRQLTHQEGLVRFPVWLPAVP